MEAKRGNVTDKVNRGGKFANNKVKVYSGNGKENAGSW